MPRADGLYRYVALHIDQTDAGVQGWRKKDINVLRTASRHPYMGAEKVLHMGTAPPTFDIMYRDLSQT